MGKEQKFSYWYEQIIANSSNLAISNIVLLDSGVNGVIEVLRCIWTLGEYFTLLRQYFNPPLYQEEPGKHCRILTLSNSEESLWFCWASCVFSSRLSDWIANCLALALSWSLNAWISSWCSRMASSSSLLWDASFPLSHWFSYFSRCSQKAMVMNRGLKWMSRTASSVTCAPWEAVNHDLDFINCVVRVWVLW